MTTFIVEPAFWEIFPDARLGIVVCRGIDNSGESNPEIVDALVHATGLAVEHVPNPEFSSNAIIQTWRKAFQQFPGKKGARSSVEAMLKRAAQGKGVGTINPLVDIYNTVSLTYGVPVGGEDLASVVGDIRLTTADGGEEFVTYGSDKSEPPVAGEVVYKDDAGAICRNWNWREAVRTMLTETTTDAFMCIEQVDHSQPGVLENAVAELHARIAAQLGGTQTTHIVDRDHPGVEIG